MIESIVFASLSLVLCVLFCWFRAQKATVYSLMLKTFASLCFILSAVFAVKASGASSFALLCVCGLVFGLVGDILLDMKIMYPKEDNQYFISGTLSFAIGHIFYFLGAMMFCLGVIPDNLVWNILASIGAAALLTAAILLPSKKMGMNFGKNLIVVIMYSLVLSFMMAFSVSIAIFVPVFWIFASGLVCFLLSDLVLSLQYFGGKTAKVWIYVNHLLYYAAQILIALSVLFVVIK